MSRWNIQSVIFFSHDGRSRELEFDCGKVNIVTGASNTGKTAIIKTIDYCMGSTDCDIPIYIKDRTSCVSVKWSNTLTELLVSRSIPEKVRSKTSTKMFIEYGNTVNIPETITDLKGKTTREQARVVMSQLFGIGEVDQIAKPEEQKTRISVRQLVPYIFLSKGVIDSETTLLHGLDDQHAAKNIMGAMPFFLGLLDEEELAIEKRIKQLQKAITAEERKKQKAEKDQEKIVNKCHGLILEAMQVGIFDKTSSLPDDLDDLLLVLNKLANWKGSEVNYPDESGVEILNREKGREGDELKRLRRKRKSAINMKNAAGDFSDVTKKQIDKVKINQLFNCEAPQKICPVCSGHLKKSSEQSEAIDAAFVMLRKERKVVQKHRPSLEKYIEKTTDKIIEKEKTIKKYNHKIEKLVSESDQAKELRDSKRRGDRTAGKISQFLEDHIGTINFDERKLENYTRNLEELEGEFDIDTKEERLDVAQISISEYASDIFSYLPRGEPCDNGKIIFRAKKPEILIRDAKINRNVRFKEIGSDENYLSIHVSLIFALQRYFEEAKRPVPGVVILDQVSRPYYPSEKYSDIVELEQDDDTVALKKHFDFLFREVERRSGLQVIVLEHAFFKNDKEFSKATKYRWPKKGKEKLIPTDWPTRH
ncbi:hypothetical protein GMJAKD_10685 [Candidatus Electrothrix aarhusensis]